MEKNTININLIEVMEQYIKPEICVMELQPDTILALSVEIEQEENGNADTNKRRGTWGNLWDE
jgi:hypothetical protein